MQTVQLGTDWFPDTTTIDTRISGNVNTQEVIFWEQSLHHALAQIPDHGEFRIMVDLFGFKAVDFEAHKRFRAIIPLTLSHYGWKVGYVDLFEEHATAIHYSNTRGIRCFAAAHAHQDETKIGLYERSYSRTDEHYFTDPVEARKWLALIQSPSK